MAPFSTPFESEELPDRVQFVQKAFKEKRRKGGKVDLNKCELLELVQYSCNPPDEGIPPPGVVTSWEKRMKGEPATAMKQEKSWLSYEDDSQYSQSD